MERCSRAFAVSVLALLLSACGGGGSGGSTIGGGTAGGGTTTKTPTQILADAKSASTSQLSTAARTLADNAYTGSTAKAELDIVLAQQVYRIMLDDNLFAVPEIAEQELDGAVSEDGSIDTRLSCDRGGSVSYNGKFQENGIGKMTMEFDDCLSYYNDYAISGIAAISIESVSEQSMLYAVYFNGLGWEQQENVSLSGVITFDESYNPDTGLYSLTSSQYVTAQIDEESYFIEADMLQEEDYYSPHSEVEGRIYVSSRGYVDFSLSAQEYSLPYLNSSTFYFNDGEAYLNFAYGSVAYIADTDGDGEKDAGRIEDLYTFMDTPLSDLALQSLDDISSPPEASSVQIVTERLVNSSDIVVEPDYYFDYETPREELAVSYNWYINDVLVDNVHGDTLPAFTAAADDEIRVTFVVSDGTFSTESRSRHLWLEVSPSVLTATDIPDVISQGNTVIFSVIMTNDDFANEENLAALTLAPEGATMSDDGTVTWQVPENLLFSHQQYTFGFSNKLDPNHHIEESLTLTVEGEDNMPLFRTGIEVPARNKSQWVADFDGDGRNELLSTDNYERVFLLAMENGRYQQKWAYPYIFSPDQHIVQVMPMDRDQNGTPEILVISEHSMWVIDDLNRPGRQLFETEAYLRSALLADVDGDGENEIIYQSASDDYSSDDSVIIVAELDDELSEIRVFYPDEVRDMAVGNVDADSNLELVVNNGMVYDLTTGANEWYLGTGFGQSFVAVGDLNGDGIDEIIGVDNWSTLFIFDAINKSQLASQAVGDTCDARTFNLYNDNTDELVVSDCQWGNVTGYRLNNTNQLEMLWQVDLQDHGSTSLAMGDIDNDGVNEVLWGSGVSSSGADVLVTADIASDSASLKTDTSDVQLDSFTASGWSDIFVGDRRAVFMAPSTESGYDGLAVITLTDSGEMTVANELSSGWYTGRYSVTTDYNNDGAGDIFLPSAGPNTEGFGVYRLSDMAAQWTMTGDHNTSVRQIKALDVNSDGFDDAIIVDDNMIKVLDIQNQVQLASYSFGNSVNDFDMAIIDGTLTVVAAQYDMLQVLTLGTNAFSAAGSMQNTGCNNVLIYGEGDNRGVVCWESYGSDYWRTMKLQAGELSDMTRVSLDINVGDIALDPTDATRFIVASDVSDGWGTDRSTIHSFTTEGHVIWSSPDLIGGSDASSLRVAEQEDGSLEILLATSFGMYWIH